MLEHPGETVLLEQAKFNTAMQLGSVPPTKFNSELKSYVPFVTMFKNNFESIITDSNSLFAILLRYLAVSLWRQYNHAFSVGH